MTEGPPAPPATALGAPPPRAPGARGTLRQWAYSVLEDGHFDSVTSRIAGTLLIALIVSNVVASALETIPSMSARFDDLFSTFEDVSLFAYTIEYFVRVWCSVEDPRIAAGGRFRGRLFFALRPLMIIDFLAFAPGYLGIFGIDLRALRIFRLFRLLKLARYSQALQALFGVLIAERASLLASFILLLSTMCLDGELMHLAEGTVQPHKFGTLPDGMYWALTTLTTVGYGDLTPITPFGQLIAAFTMVSGLALFALPIGIISNGFVNGLNRRRFAITWSMLRRFPLFQGFDVDALNDIIECAGASIIREHVQVAVRGRDASELFVIMAGSAIAEDNEGGRELGPGALFGEESLRLDGIYGVMVTARTDMRVLVLAGDEARRLTRKYPLFAERIAELTGHVPGEAPARADLAGRVKALEQENAQLRRALSDLVLDRMAVREGEPAP